MARNRDDSAIVKKAWITRRKNMQRKQQKEQVRRHVEGRTGQPSAVDAAKAEAATKAAARRGRRRQSQSKPTMVKEDKPFKSKTGQGFKEHQASMARKAADAKRRAAREKKVQGYLTSKPPGEAIGRKSTDSRGNPIPESGVTEKRKAGERDAKRRSLTRSDRRRAAQSTGERIAANVDKRNTSRQAAMEAGGANEAEARVRAEARKPGKPNRSIDTSLAGRKKRMASVGARKKANREAEALSGALGRRAQAAAQQRANRAASDRNDMAGKLDKAGRVIRAKRKRVTKKGAVSSTTSGVVPALRKEVRSSQARAKTQAAARRAQRDYERASTKADKLEQQWSEAQNAMPSEARNRKIARLEKSIDTAVADATRLLKIAQAATKKVD